MPLSMYILGIFASAWIIMTVYSRQPWQNWHWQFIILRQAKWHGLIQNTRRHRPYRCDCEYASVPRRIQYHCTKSVMHWQSDQRIYICYGRFGIGAVLANIQVAQYDVELMRRCSRAHSFSWSQLNCRMIQYAHKLLGLVMPLSHWALASRGGQMALIYYFSSSDHWCLNFFGLDKLFWFFFLRNVPEKLSYGGRGVPHIAGRQWGSYLSCISGEPKNKGTPRILASNEPYNNVFMCHDEVSSSPSRFSNACAPAVGSKICTLEIYWPNLIRTDAAAVISLEFGTCQMRLIYNGAIAAAFCARRKWILRPTIAIYHAIQFRKWRKLCAMVTCAGRRWADKQNEKAERTGY